MSVAFKSAVDDAVLDELRAITGDGDRVLPNLSSRINRTRVPAPGAESRSTVPPDCTTMPCTVARPSPVPPASPRVVKNGSNARARTSGGIPAPVSATVRATAAGASPTGAADAVAMVTVPPPGGIASRALVVRLRSTRSNCRASA